MTCYQVVYLKQDCGEIEEVQCMGLFATKQEANECEKRLRNKASTEYNARLQYIDDYVNTISVTSLTDIMLGTLVRRTHRAYMRPQDARKELASELKSTRRPVKLEGYNPPPTESMMLGSFYVVEVTGYTLKENNDVEAEATGS